MELHINDGDRSTKKSDYVCPNVVVIKFDYTDLIKTSGDPCNPHQGCLCDGIYGQ